MRERELFDEAGYLRLYPGIADAIADGIEPSAWHHYDKHGRSEGRRPNDVDAEFYLAAYPQAGDDIAAGLAADAAEHYPLFGRARGYLPNATAPRPADAPAPSIFGWLWTDLPQALDMVEGRLALGRLKQREAAMLRSWIRDGFVTLDRSIDADMVAAAALDLERAFAGAMPPLRFACDAVAPEHVLWQPELNPHPAVALDVHMMSRAIRDAIFAAPIAEFLGLLFDAHMLCAQSRGSLRDAVPPAQQGSPSAAFSLKRQFVVAWIALEDTPEDAPLQHYVGSHRFPGLRGARLAERAAAHGLESADWRGTAGQVVIRHADLIHGGGALPEARTRRGLLLHYCPRSIAPAYAETVPTRLWRHESHAFITQHYPDMSPLD